jgi:putative ABC transport system ATP-binding protein
MGTLGRRLSPLQVHLQKNSPRRAHVESDRQAITLTHVVKRYNGASKTAQTGLPVKTGTADQQQVGNGAALNDINLSIDQGEFVVIAGKSGSGKSTLLNVITGIDTVTEGEVVVNGIPVHRLNGNKLATWRGINVGIVFQFFQLMPTLTILENVMLPMEFASIVPKGDQENRARMLLEKLDILHLAHKFPHAVSGGEKQRAAIARALANNPSILVADEPTGNLDTINTALIHRLIDSLSKEGKTIVYVTHERDLPMAYSRIVRLHDGHIAEIEENGRRS